MHDRATGVERLLDVPDRRRRSRWRWPATPCRATPRTPRRCSMRSIRRCRTNPVYISRAPSGPGSPSSGTTPSTGSTRPRATLPDAAEWWYERRTLIAASCSATATPSAPTAPPPATPKARKAGWSKRTSMPAGSRCASSTTPRRATAHFEAMAKLSTLPDSVTQANYWLGRARLAARRRRRRQGGLHASPPHIRTIYYGQLARAGARAQAGAELRDHAGVAATASRRSRRNEVVQRHPAARRQRPEATWRCRCSAASRRRSRPAASCCWRRGWRRRIDAHHLAIVIADTAEKRGMPLDLFSFPKDGLPADASSPPIDKAAIYAIARQESRFQVDAVSSRRRARADAADAGDGQGNRRQDRRRLLAVAG